MIKEENQILMSFKSNLKFAELALLVLQFLKSQLDIDEEEYFKIEISLREAIANAMIHGNGGDLNKQVHIKISWDKTWLRLVVRDESQRQIEMSDIEAILKKKDLLACNGRGIMIMKNYMDRFEFHPCDSGSEVILEKKLQ